MGKFDNLWKVVPEDEVIPSAAPLPLVDADAPPPVPITFQTQIAPALGELKKYLATKYGDRATQIAQAAQMLGEIKSKETAEKAVSIIAEATKLNKEAEGERKELAAPLLSFKKGLDGSFNNYTDPMASLIRNLKGGLSTYQARVEMERLRQEKAAQEDAARIQAELDKEAKETGVEAPQVVVPAVPPTTTTTRTEAGTASVVKRWRCRVVNADKVPRKYCDPSQRKLDEAVRGGVRKIAGTEIKEESDIRIRT